MDEQLTISTPEQVAFQYEMAGIGSRFVAALLDHLIIIVVLALISCGASTLGAYSMSSVGDTLYYWILALLVLIYFLFFWGYFVLFETVWNGQTPGKRAGRLRVIRHNGQPVGAGEVLVRNLVRLVDFLPGFYGVGLLTMFIDKEQRRLGDFAAGTIVVREGQQTRLQDVRIAQPTGPTAAPTLQPQYSVLQGFSQTPTYSNPPGAPAFQPSQRPDPLPGISIRDVTAEDYALMRELIARVNRREMAPERALDLTTRMAHGIASTIGQNFAEWQARGWEPVTFLQSVLDAREVRGS